ncbi:MAG: OsmC family protein [Chloroflexi bacterium]|nr:OsmC family protein [Chloroflexota bacterium]
MGAVTVRWITGKQFVGVDSSRHSVVLSTQDDQNGTGMKPAELLLIALASCTAVDVVEILNKKRQPLSRLEIRVEGQQDPEPPWAFRKIHVHYCLSGSDLTPAAVQQAIELSEGKYCSVAATVRGVAEITTDFEII